jgi:drug/metabolite transporter (DMT)-like permease
MSGAALVLVLAAACVHAGWNALAKRAESSLAFLTSSVALATLGLGPLAAWLLLRDGFPRAAAPFVVTTVVVHALYFYALARAYGAGDYSVVYPVSRGLGVALVPLLGVPLLGERLSALGIAGVALVVVGIVALQRSGGPARRARAGAGLGWAVLTGLTIGAYSVNDKVGVTHLHPVPYIAFIGLGMTLVMAPVAARDPVALRREWARNGRAILVASTMNLTAYLLVLFAFRLSKAAYVVAGRESSVVISALLGSLWLKEAPLGPRLAGALVVLAGVACIALAR